MAEPATADGQDDAVAVAILALLRERGEVGLAAAARLLGLRQSELRRQLSLLGDASTLDGLGLVEVRDEGGRSPRLRLSGRGRDWLAAQS
jgi:DNA-binding transcriptional ArsR family regulator